MKSKLKVGSIVQAAFVSTFPPRQCGLATFTKDLIEAIDGLQRFPPARVIAVGNIGTHYLYDKRVSFELIQEDASYYPRAATYINNEKIDVVSIQHEFGIYGGKDGEHLLTLLRAIEKPVVTTVHTVLSHPDEHKEMLIREISRRSSAVVVMAQIGAKILMDRYGVPKEKIRVIHHGVPVKERNNREALKAKLGLKDRMVLSTFGLLGPGKGIEYMIKAMKKVVTEHPNSIYLVLGGTHPNIKLHEGEWYRDKLMRMVSELELSENVKFVDRYLTKDELLDYLDVTDVYVTPYVGREQICSGTLAYAVSLGKAVVSTPYLYATELLGGNRGVLVRFRDSDSIAWAVSTILRYPRLQRELEDNAREFGLDMTWPKVAEQYAELFSQVTTREATRGKAQTGTNKGQGQYA